MQKVTDHGSAGANWICVGEVEVAIRAARCRSGGEGDRKQESLRVAVRGETYAYWYLRRQRYVFIAKNCAPAREKGELDLVGFDGDTLALWR
jgi:hypothetical protein